MGEEITGAVLVGMVLVLPVLAPLLTKRRTAQFDEHVESALGLFE